MHVAYDGRGDGERLTDAERVNDFLAELPDKIGMTKIAGPLVSSRPDVTAGIVIIAESHCSLHAYPDGRFFADVFSCKDFDPYAPGRALRDAFGVEDCRVTRLTVQGEDRGLLPIGAVSA